MKHTLAVVTIMASAPLAFAQGSSSRASIVQHYCGVTEMTFGPEVQRVKGIEARLGAVLRERQIPGPSIRVAVVDSDVINSSDVPINPRESLICIPVGIVRFFGDNEGEMAFVVGHETGHAIDAACKSEGGRAAVTPPSLSGAIDRLLFGSAGRQLDEQRTCEARADTIGFALLAGAGYDPCDAEGALEQLGMSLGDVSTGVGARLASLLRDHPMTPDRIKNLQALLNQKGVVCTGGSEPSFLLNVQVPAESVEMSVLGGNGIDEDARYISTLFAQANNGDVGAQIILGFRYETGNGLPKNLQLARYWYSKAAEHGSKNAKESLDKVNKALNASTGGANPPIPEGTQAPTRNSGGDTDYIATLLRQANSGDVAAQFILGCRYESGNGVQIDMQMARYWYTKAANGGSTRAKEALESLK